MENKIVPYQERFSTERYYFKDTPFNLLMQQRISEVLIVCSKYDKFMLEEDGRIDEQIFQEYVSLNLRYPPKFTHTATGEEALRMMEAKQFHLVITMLNVGKLKAFDLAQTLKEKYPQIPVVILSAFSREDTLRVKNDKVGELRYIFSWLGNANILLAIVKLLEDRLNVRYDVEHIGVQVIILVEDNIRYYSSYLPNMYRILFQQARCIMDEGLNEWEQTMRMRSRPKILLATDYEQAMDCYNRYRNHVLGVITDISYQREGKDDPTAGLRLVETIRNDNARVPLLVQSSQREHEQEVLQRGAGFIFKHSKMLLNEMRNYIKSNYGFGEFPFIDPATKEVIQIATSLRELQEKLEIIPDESFAYHVSHFHFSRWLKARSLHSLAQLIKDTKHSDFESMASFRRFIIDTIKNYRLHKGRGTIANFNRDTFDEYTFFARIGYGSLGGKGRGLAFIDSLLKNEKLRYRFDNLVISIPRTIVISTDIFEEFMDRNNLYEVAHSDIDDDQMLEAFLDKDLPFRVKEDLFTYLSVMRSPIAVRSSSLLEDSLYQPFAGIYTTYMLPNNNENIQIRFRDLIQAIKCVYASTYYQASKAYLAATHHIIDEEKMAVVLQEVAGSVHNGRCYPTFSGVARSLNFYPVENEKTEDGIVNIAVGLGKTVVDGGVSLRFSPRYPKKIIQLSDVETTLKSTQNTFYAINMEQGGFVPQVDDSANLLHMEIKEAEEDGTLDIVTSTYDMQNGTFREGPGLKGKKVVTFAGILKYNLFPLTEVLRMLLEISCREMNVPIEMEFAVDLNSPRSTVPVFSFLQIRPIVEGLESGDVCMTQGDIDNSLVFSSKALGNGVYKDISDLIYVKPETFNPADSEKIADCIEQLNRRLEGEKRNYILIVPGRLGSSDPWLGIPMKWQGISAARIIVEMGLKNFQVDPSQGSHFFQNLTSLRIAYLSVFPFSGDGKLDEDSLKRLPAHYEDHYVRHIRKKETFVVKVDGKRSRAVILEKPPADNSPDECLL
ncbi:MAG: phosphoenolpyruvate synthase [Spirochaetales bacterium]|nr:phosphoenolpyruvate synthase [Spirochaetales bacterium]